MHDFLVAIVAALCCVPMAVLFSKDSQAAPAAVPLVTTAETLVLASAAQTVEPTTGKAAIKGFVTLTVGTNTTAVTVRLYRGATSAGTLIGTAVAQAGNFAAGSPAGFSAVATDTLTNVGTAQYCMTVQQTSASANGSATTALLEVEILQG